MIIFAFNVNMQILIHGQGRPPPHIHRLIKPLSSDWSKVNKSSLA